MAKKKTARDDDISTRPAIRKALVQVFDDVEKAFEDQRERSDKALDYWDLYNGKLSDRQFYNGTSQIFVPIISDAIKARVTRFTNQIFPQSGRYVDVTAGEADIPYATMALLEQYVRMAKLRTRIMPALVKQGDIEGQYTVYVGWQERKRHVVSRVQTPISVMGAEMPELGEVDDVEESVVVDAWPSVEIISDADWVCTLAASDSIGEALARGGSVGILRRWTKAAIEQKVDDGDITQEAGDDLIGALTKRDAKSRNPTKQNLDAAGIKGEGRDKHAVVHEVWTMLKVDGTMRLCRAYSGGDDIVLGAKLNPYWCDECPLLTQPVEKVAGVLKGRAPIASVEDLQILANDTINEGADTAHFSAMPIIMTDPEKNPRVSSMVLGLAAIWETSPTDTQFAQFPELWATALNRLGAIKEQVFQSLGVNPAMMPQSTGGDSKRNQAEIATEQQVDILTTADACTVLEEGILTPMLARFAAYDSQFREEEVTIRVYGEVGLKAEMEQVAPYQLNKRFEFRWLGVEAARNAAQRQEQIAGLNVMKGIPPAMYAGYKLNLAPMMIQMAEGLFGPRLAPLIFKKDDPLTVSPEIEDQMLLTGFVVDTHPGDDDQAHMQAHTAAMQQDPSQDIHGTFRDHIQRHQIQMQAKAQAQQMQQMGADQAQQPPGLPGSPGGAGPGVAGTPRPGAQPAGPRLIKGPEGMIPPDSMPAAGAVGMPRKM